MPNTFDPDGRPDVMSNQDQLAYLRATGGTIDDRPLPKPKEVAAKPEVRGVIDPQAAKAYEERTAAEDEARRSAKKVRQTSFGLPMTGR